MRLWSVHPRYLDATGLVALWREALLAQAVLRGETRGYRSHPQLQRFLDSADPCGNIAAFLWPVQHEAVRRGYRFNAAKIRGPASAPTLTVSAGQLGYEWQHLIAKLTLRAPDWLARLGSDSLAEPHPLFTVVAGDVAPWEIVRPPGGPT